MRKIILCFLPILIIIHSCATYKLQQSSDAAQAIYPNDKTISHTFYLIGDAGNETFNTKSDTFEALSQSLNNANENSTLLFLGDNIYPAGMPTKESPERKKAEEHLETQINTVKNFKGKTIFIPGNHDWYSEGTEGLKREEKWIEEKLGKNSFLPEKGCPLKTININSEIVLLLVDSQWYLTNWNKDSKINENCDLKTRTLFLEEFKNEIKKARGKTTIVALHHPMYSNGPHNGQYSLKSHLKPFPIIGSLKNLLRRTTGIANTDLSNKFYNELKQNLVASAKQNDKVVFVSGHEHNLQYILENGVHQIVSGSGSKTSPTRNTGGGKFSYGANGFAVLECYNDGSANVKFFSTKEKKIIYETELLDPNTPKNTISYPVEKNAVTKAAIYKNSETEKSKTYRFFWGERYRKYYSLPVTTNVAYLDTLKGGLIPIRKGGGNQSKSLRLKTKEGKQYVMRALRKNASQYIQATLFKDKYVENLYKDTAPEALINDVFTGSYPYAPLVIPTLSEAINLAHSKPKLFYIPKQATLGNFNNEFGDELYYFEEAPSDGDNELEYQNFKGKVLSTSEVLQKIQENKKNTINEKEYAKARLFDMLIGDWDRHQDQWRWLEYKENDNNSYLPFPRDRDQAFSRMSDGFVLGTSVNLVPAASLLRKYGDDIKRVKDFNAEPFPLDLAFFKSLTKKDWQQQALFIQEKLSDQVIENAFQNIPKEVNDSCITNIKNTLKNRRANLQKIAERYCKELFKFVVLTATEQKDSIQINIQTNGQVRVSMYKKSKTNKVTESYFDREYDPKETKELWIYGLDSDDQFIVNGKSKKIKIRLIGGQNNDTYTIENGKKIVVYDYKSKKNTFINKNGTLKLRDDYETNTYDYKKTIKNSEQFIPTVGYNPDQALNVGINNTHTLYGFERNPFTSQHTTSAQYFFATNGFEVNYKGEFARAIKNLNFIFNAKLQSPNTAQNFFGYGNETSNFDKKLGFNYNRVKVSEINCKPELVWRARGGVQINFGIEYQVVKVDETNNRYIKNNTEVPQYIFNRNDFLGMNAQFFFENYDTTIFPTIGMNTSIELGYKRNVTRTNDGYGYLIPQLSFYNKLEPSGKLVLATKLKGHLIFGNDFELYQAAIIGGVDGLRGYRNFRFTGKNAFYQNTDLRYSFNTLKTKIIPIKWGVYSSFDYGRVWINDDDSQKWHNSYGGGLFLNATESFLLNIGAFHSVEMLRFMFRLSFGF
jgi:Calcineurin-like phosphoesterase